MVKSHIWLLLLLPVCLSCRKFTGFIWSLGKLEEYFLITDRQYKDRTLSRPSPMYEHPVIHLMTFSQRIRRLSDPSSLIHSFLLLCVSSVTHVIDSFALIFHCSGSDKPKYRFFQSGSFQTPSLLCSWRPSPDSTYSPPLNPQLRAINRPSVGGVTTNRWDSQTLTHDTHMSWSECC